jgi:ribosomal protein S17E
MEHFPEKFSIDFESNKNNVYSLTNARSKKLGNRIARCITKTLTRIDATEKFKESSDTE